MDAQECLGIHSYNKFVSEKILEHQLEVEAHLDTLVKQGIITQREAQITLRSKYPRPLVLEREKIDSELKQDLQFFKDRTTPFSVYLSEHFGSSIMDSVIARVVTEKSHHTLKDLDKEIAVSDDYSKTYFGFSSPIRLDNGHFLLFMYLKKHKPTWYRDKRAYVVKCGSNGTIDTVAQFYVWHPKYPNF